MNDVRTPQPNLRKTPRGGKMMAIKMSMQLAAPAIFCYVRNAFEKLRDEL